MKRNRITGIVLAAANGILLFICAALYLGKDRQEPELTFEAVETVYREGIGMEELLKGVSAQDKEDGEISGRIVIEKISENREENTAVVFYAVSDRAGNVARASRMFPAVFTQRNEGNVEGRFLDAGIEAELKEGNIVNSGAEDKETESDNEERKKDSEEGSTEDAGREDIPNNTENIPENNTENIPENREQGSDASQTPVPSSAPAGQPAPSPVIRGETPEPAGEQRPEGREEETGQGTEPEEALGPREAPGREEQDTDTLQAPVLTLKVSETEVRAGQGPAWVDLIETLKDDKDGYETLFRNLSVSRYDRNKPGAYQVSVWTEDAEGNRSQSVPLTIIVK